MSSPVSSAPAAGPRAGVIHDIGYRHYDGPRLGRWPVVRSLFVHSLLADYGIGRSAKSKVMPFILLGLMFLPAVIIVALTIGLKQDSLPLEYTEYPLALQLVIAIFVAAQSPQSVSRDLRFRVTTLYFSRPLLRSDYVFAKYAAMTAALFALMVLPEAVLYLGGLLAKLPPAAETRHLLQGLAGAALMALVLAGLGLLMAAFTPRRGLGVAAIIAVFFVSFVSVGIVQGIATDHGQDKVAGYAGLFSPFTLVDGVQVWLLGASPSSHAGPPGTTGGLVFAAVTLAFIATSVGLLWLRYRKISVS